MPEQAVMDALAKIRAACDELEAAYGGGAEGEMPGEMPGAMPGGMAPEAPAPPSIIPGAYDQRRY